MFPWLVSDRQPPHPLFYIGTAQREILRYYSYKVRLFSYAQKFQGENKQRNSMKLFISYVHTDIWQVKQLVEILRSGNHEPWFDDRLLAGQDWKDELEQSIKNVMRLYIFCHRNQYTPNSVTGNLRKPHTLRFQDFIGYKVTVAQQMQVPATWNAVFHARYQQHFPNLFLLQ
ncbi:MAG: toll/interleukin-1 receptor domain-containing protein [Anaerolineae bacterium]|nr:toll/interleukin-1 receptor domain-containing protein [Anaerolineae bacterium]